VNYLLDEQLHEDVAAALQILRRSKRDRFSHVYNFGAGGIDDEDIPALCRERTVGALITANYKDFGARKVLYVALMGAGVNVVVLRPGKAKLNIENQMRLITAAINRIDVLLRDASSPILIKVDASGSCTPRSLGELLDEIEGEPEHNGP
jgi:hypothetical protein